MCVSVYIYYAYLKTHNISVYIFILYINLLVYKYNILFLNICMRVCIYIYIYSVHACYVNKTFILDAINRLTAPNRTK